MLKQFLSNSYLFGGNAPYVEELYERYLADPASVPEEWRGYFDKLQLLPAGGTNATAKDVAHAPVIESFAQRAKAGPVARAPGAEDLDRKQVSVIQLVAEYRFRGCLLADLDPLKRQPKPHIAELEPGYYDLTEADMDTVFNTGSLIGSEQQPLREIIRGLQETYCGSLGVEYMYLSSRVEKRWIQERLEPVRSKPNFAPDYKKHILERLTAAEGLERYLHTRYVGQKRFSLEGGDTLIPVLDNLLQRAGEAGVQELVLGMAHRGRLNVLVNTLGKMPKDLFSEFEGKHDDALASGDVKYHQGFSSDINTPGGPMHLTLAFNPSHLEIVNPVVEGSVRARQHRRKDRGGDQVLPVLIHGDAAVAGQGVVMETLNLSQTRGYGTGGTVHIVINNQIGFTTSDTRDIRSTLYCTDVMKMIEAPIFHVNGDDPEACVMAIEIALDYRGKFKKDVVVDIVCFRKLGHNEQDEPMVTQPLMYKIVNAHPGTRKLYAGKLAAQGVIAGDEADRMVATFRQAMDGGYHTNKTILSNFKPPFAVDWSKYRNTKWNENDDTMLPIPDPALQLRRGRIRRIDAEEADAPQDERHDGGVQAEPGREADRGDDAVEFHRARHPCQHFAAKIVDGTLPGRLVEGLDFREIYFFPEFDFPGAKLLQPVGFMLFAGERDDVIAEFRQRGDGNGADAAGGAVDDHRPARWVQAVVFHLHDREARGVSRGAEGHRLPQRHPLGQLYGPIRGDAGVLGVAAVVLDAQLVPDGKHRVALGEARIGRGHHRPGEVDAADARGPQQDASLAGGRERVLVIDVGVGHAHHKFAGIEVVEPHVDESGLNFSVDLFQPESLERLHRFSPYYSCSCSGSLTQCFARSSWRYCTDCISVRRLAVRWNSAAAVVVSPPAFSAPVNSSSGCPSAPTTSFTRSS